MHPLPRIIHSDLFKILACEHLVIRRRSHHAHFQSASQYLFSLFFHRQQFPGPLLDPKLHIPSFQLHFPIRFRSLALYFLRASLPLVFFQLEISIRLLSVRLLQSHIQPCEALFFAFYFKALFLPGFEFYLFPALLPHFSVYLYFYRQFPGQLLKEISIGYGEFPVFQRELRRLIHALHFQRPGLYLPLGRHDPVYAEISVVDFLSEIPSVIVFPLFAYPVVRPFPYEPARKPL